MGITEESKWSAWLIVKIDLKILRRNLVNATLACALANHDLKKIEVTVNEKVNETEFAN